MTGVLNPYGDIDGAIANPVQLRALLLRLTTDMQAVKAQSAVGGGVTVPPAPASWTVAGVQGHTQITIVNPQNALPATIAQRIAKAALPVSKGNPTLVPIYHQLQSATSVLFDAAGSVQTYGPDVKLFWDIPNPNQTLFWRLRSSYDQQNWNNWAIYEDPNTCGAFPIWSGLITTATTLVNQALSYTGGSPLSQSGATSKILVAATTWKAGSTLIKYNAGSVDPGAIGGPYYVFADDPKRLGGAVTFQASLNVADCTGTDGRVYFGFITTAGGGGGTGSGGGAGACLVGESMILMADGSEKPMAKLRRGDLVMGLDGKPDEVVRVVMHSHMPSFGMRLDNGMVQKGSSSRHPWKFHQSGYALTEDLQPSDVLQTVKGGAGVAERYFLGSRTVYAPYLARLRAICADGIWGHNANNSIK